MDAQNEDYAGPEQREITHERLPARDNPGVFQKLHSWGRGAIGKALLATTLSGGVAGVHADDTPGHHASDKTTTNTLVGNSQDSPVKLRIVQPVEIAEDGTVLSVRLGGRILPLHYDAPDFESPQEGVYYKAESDTYHHLTGTGQLMLLEYSPQTPEQEIDISNQSKTNTDLERKSVGQSLRTESPTRIQADAGASQTGASKEGADLDSLQQQIIQPYGMYEDGSVASVMLGIKKYHIKYEAPDMSNPKEGIYYHAASDAYYHLTDRGQVTKMKFSPERIQPPKGGTWVRYKSGANGKTIIRPQTEAEVNVKRRSQRHIRGYSPAPVQRPVMQAEQAGVEPADMRVELAARNKGEMPVAAGQEKSANFQEVSIAVAEAEKMVKKLGLLTIEHGYDTSNKKEALLRERSIIEPTGFIPMRITISTEISNDGNGLVLLPCPRDVGDQIHVASSAYAIKGGKKMNVECKIVYSQDAAAVGGKGYENPFMHMKIKGSGNMAIHNEHIILMPVYPPVDERQFLQSMGPSAGIINRAAQTAAAVPWDGRYNGIDSGFFRRFGRGDCGVKAAVGRDAGGGLVEAVEGYSLDPVDVAKFGGKHCINIARSNGGLLTFDPRTSQDLYMGPQHQYIITEVGGAFVVPGWSRKVNKASNAGFYAGVRDYKLAGLTGATRIGAGTPQEIADYAKALWDDRMKKYQGGDIAFNR